MWVFLIIFLIAWVASPLVFIPMLISMSSKVKKKDDEIRRLIDRLREEKERSSRAGDSRLTIEDIRGTSHVEPEETKPVTSAPYVSAEPTVSTISPDMIMNESAAMPVSESAPQPAPTEYTILPDTITDKNTESKKSGPVRRPHHEVKPKVRRKLETGHILFAIGVVLVFVAGLIFATSMWSVMPSLIKVATLIGAAMFFVIVAWILEAKLKLREASVTMFVLGSAFMSLTVIAIGYFAWFGTAFSLGSGSRYLVISTAMWVLCLTLMFGFKLYKNVIFKLIAFVSSCAAFALLARHLLNKGDRTLLVTGLYLFILLFIICRREADILKKTAVIASILYVIVSLALYLAFGFSTVMSLVMVVDIAMMVFIAASNEDEDGRNPYVWLYYAIPVTGAFLIYNTSDIFRVTIPHGDILTGMILVIAAFFIYRYISVKGVKRFNNLSSLITLLFCYSIYFGKLWYAMDRGHDGFSDITEVLLQLLVFALFAVISAVEYIRTVRPLKKGAGFYTWAYLISLCVYFFMSLYVFMPVIGYTDLLNEEYLGSLIPTCITALVMLAVIILYHLKSSEKSMTYGLTITRRICAVMLHMALIVSFTAFLDVSHDTYAAYVLNLPLIAVIIMYQAHTRIRKYNPDGLVTAAMLPFVLMEGYEELTAVLTGDPEAISVNMAFELKLILFLAVLIIGLFVYRRLFLYDKEKKILLIDWNAPAALIILALTASESDSWTVRHVTVRLLVALAIFSLYTAFKLKGLARRVALCVMTGFLCGAYMCQDFIHWNRDFDTELICLALPVFAAVIHYVIFKGKERIVSYISFGLTCLFFLIEWACISEVVSDPAMPVVNIKLTIFLLVTLAANGYAVLRKSLRYDIMALVFAVLLTASCIANRRGGHLIIAAAINVFLIVYYYRRKVRQPLSIVPLLTLLAVIYDTLYVRVMQFISTGSFSVENGILKEADPDYSIPCIIWIGVFAIMLGLGRFVHKKLILRVADERPFTIDWFTILSIIPVLIVWDLGNAKFVWSVSLLIALYLFGYYGRVSEFLNKPVLTAIAVCLAIAWWTQPLVRVGELFVTEYRIFGFLALVYVITKIIYKRELEGGLDFMYYSSIASVIWQSISAIKSARLFDVIILGVVLLIIIVVAFEKKSRRWFLLSAISLVCLFLYMSRDFWRRIVWPVYVFAVGLVLIFFATRNEYRKKHPVPEEEKKKLFEGWGR